MNSGPRLAICAQGPDAQRAQAVFVMMRTLGFGGSGGAFGTITKRGVVAFRESGGRPAEGVRGRGPGAGMPADPNTPALRRGSTGGAVIGLQKGLRKFG